MKVFLEQAAHFMHRHYYFLATALTLFALAVVLADTKLRFIEAAIQFEKIKGLGKAVGALAVGFAIVSMSYYGIRDAYAVSRRVKINLPTAIDGWVKYAITMLRLAHPLIGTLVFSVVLVHGYIMWHIWSAGNFNYSVETGLVSSAMLVVLAFSGLFIRWMPRFMKLRHVHRLVGGMFLISLIIHKIIE